jgi:Reverse transcriptase (RNA-dependent DNA polymerase)
MKKFFEAAITNVYRHGDTDIFPFPIENRIFSDKLADVVALLSQTHEAFDVEFAQNAPIDIRELSPVGPNGFRSASQLDPYWNAFLLGEVLSIAEQIESARISTQVVYSYRLNTDTFLSGDIFRTDISWSHFFHDSRELSNDFEFVLVCDIADCYGRISHHKLENALRLLNIDHKTQKSILKYLSYTTGTKSSGLPVGGPAARLLAEIALNSVDRLLQNSGLIFKRYADDFHIFCQSKPDAYKALLLLSETLENDSLILQRSKTRIMSRAEFISQADLILGERGATETPVRRLMSLSLRYDPYSKNAEANYEHLREELSRIDIISLLNEQLSRTQIHLATTKRIVSALVHLDEDSQFGAAASMLNNMHLLHPIASNVFITISRIFQGLSATHKDQICEQIRDLYESGHEAMSIPLHVAYANRIIGQNKNQENESYLHRCFEREQSPMIRRDIFLIFANWQNFPWLSIRLRRFSSLSEWERRAAILASFYMMDEGKHWRDHTANRFSPVELLVRDWRSQKKQNFELPVA